MLAGLCFRVAAVPLQFDAPDVYEGSPVVIAATLAWVPKAVGFLAIVRTLTVVLSAKGGGEQLAQNAVMFSWAIAAATMDASAALLQNNLKRLLAYSSIAHAGYMMVGVTAAFADDRHAAGTIYGIPKSIFFYLVVYALMTLGFFGGIMALRFQDRPVETVDDLAGLGSKPARLCLGHDLPAEVDRNSAACGLLGSCKSSARCWQPARGRVPDRFCCWRSSEC